jgi:hypothetical protein
VYQELLLNAVRKIEATLRPTADGNIHDAKVLTTAVMKTLIYLVCWKPIIVLEE